MKETTCQLKVGDLVSRTKTRRIITKPTDKKDVPFKIIKIRNHSAIGEDGNNHFIKSLKLVE